MSNPNLPCFLCSKELEQRIDKNQKPYFVCDPCGVQIFIRGPQGIENLEHLIKAIKKHDFFFHEHSSVLLEIQAILTEIRRLNKELDALDSVFDVFADANARKDKNRIRQSLQNRVEALIQRLERFASREA